MSLLSKAEGDIADLVSAGSLGIGLVAALGAVALQGADGKAALKFGAVTILGSALGDVVLTWTKIDTRIESYLPHSSYFDPLDFISAGASVALLSYYLGLHGEQLWKSTAIAAVAGGIGRKVGGMLIHSSKKEKPVYAPGPVSSGPLKKRPGGPVVHQGGPVYAPGPVNSGPVYTTGPIMSKIGASIILP